MSPNCPRSVNLHEVSILRGNAARMRYTPSRFPDSPAAEVPGLREGRDHPRDVQVRTARGIQRPKIHIY